MGDRTEGTEYRSLEELQVIQDNRSCLGVDHVTILVDNWAGGRGGCDLLYVESGQSFSREVTERSSPVLRSKKEILGRPKQ